MSGVLSGLSGLLSRFLLFPFVFVLCAAGVMVLAWLGCLLMCRGKKE